MSIKNKLKILLAITVIGLSLVSAFTLVSLNAIHNAEETSHRREIYVAYLLEIKAAAISTIMLDPTLPETREVFADAEKTIKIKGETTLNIIKRAEIKDELKRILEQWVRYDRDSQALIKLAESNAMSANEQLIPLYNREFKPLQNTLVKFIDKRMEEAAKSKEQADETMRQTYWEVLPILALVSIINIAFVFNLSRSLQHNLQAIQQKLVPLKQGDLTQRLPTNSKDELAEISAGVNVFIEELQHLVRDARNNADAVASAAQQLSASAQQVLSSSQQQSDDTSSIASAVQQFSVSIDQVSSNAAEADHKASFSAELSLHGGTEVENAVLEIRRIQNAVNDATGQMTMLGQQAHEISSIVNAIKDVADQTNLLALNAAIEAARAGESGRGFAVVADEVRKLAERTAISAQEITDKITAIQSNTESAARVMNEGNEMVAHGVKQVEQAGQSMHQINEGSIAVRSAVSDISSALGEERSSSTEIAQKVEHIAQMTERNSAAIAQVSSSAEQLSGLASELQLGVAKFVV
jgi:methyl-accepting chemotaxis protein